MNNKIETGANGIPEMSWDLSDDISTNIFWSINIPFGSIFNNRKFGLNMNGITKVSEKSRLLFNDRIKSALQWLIDIGKAKTIDVLVERDLTNIYQFNYRVDAIQADGIPITVTGFQTVGGPSDGFTFP